jgi:hypothetical protein
MDWSWIVFIAVTALVSVIAAALILLKPVRRIVRHIRHRHQRAAAPDRADMV